MKAQEVRALDVFVIGPAIIAGGSIISKHAPERRGLGFILIAIGVGTVLYNGHNWLKREAELDAEQAQAPQRPAANKATTAIEAAPPAT